MIVGPLVVIELTTMKKGTSAVKMRSLTRFGAISSKNPNDLAEEVKDLLVESGGWTAIRQPLTSALL